MDKSRNFTMVLYPEEDLSHLFALNKLKTSGYNFVAIDHDKDTYDDYDNCDKELIGSLKKPHTHVVLKFRSPRYLEPVANELGIASNYLQFCRDVKGAELYLCHDAYPSKYQYSSECLYGPLVPEVLRIRLNEEEGVRVLQILRILDAMPCPCSYRKFLVACCEAGYYADFRRMGSGVTKLLEEHNFDGLEPLPLSYK